MTNKGSTLDIAGRLIGPGRGVYIVAEMSANHGRDYERAARILDAAKRAGADAVKLQTYTPDTLTIDCDAEPFRIKGTLWDGRTLHELYAEACMPWEWQPRLLAEAKNLGLTLFSTPFDDTSVDFLEEMGVPAHKVASFELNDTGLLRKVGATGKPVLLSTGMADAEEIAEAVACLREAGTDQIALFKCTSAYPASPAEINLRAMVDMAARFGCPTGLSDHTMGIAVPVAATALGACIIEKHFTLCRADGGPDSTFSMEPEELAALVQAVRQAEQALGEAAYTLTKSERQSRIFRRSLFVVEDIPAGGTLTRQNVRSIRPGHGLAPRHLDSVLGRKAARSIARGTPLAWDLIS